MIKDALYSQNKNGLGPHLPNNIFVLLSIPFRVKTIRRSFSWDSLKGIAETHPMMAGLDVDSALTEDKRYLALKLIEKDSKVKFAVDLEAQTISDESGNVSYDFEIDPYKKMCLLQGYDDLDFLLSLKDEIGSFEKNQVIH